MTKLLNLFRRRRDRLERDLDRELRYQVDRRVEDLIADGVSGPEARRRAGLELGGVPQVDRASRRFAMLVQGVTAFAPADLPRIDEMRMDPTAMLFALGLTLVSTAIFGLVPALHASRLDLAGGLKQGGSKATASKAGTRFRSAMVVAEVALSVVLLAAAGLLLRSFLALQHVDLGFTTDRVLVAVTEYTVGEDPSGITVRSRFFEDVLDRLRSVPGVRAASGVAFLGMGREPRPPRDYFI